MTDETNPHPPGSTLAASWNFARAVEALGRAVKSTTAAQRTIALVWGTDKRRPCPQNAPTGEEQ